MVAHLRIPILLMTIVINNPSNKLLKPRTLPLNHFRGFNPGFFNIFIGYLQTGVIGEFHYFLWGYAIFQ